MPKIKVLIVDDHKLIRLGVRSLLSPDEEIEVVGEASCGEEAIDLTMKLRPNVVLMDLLMKKGMSGIEAIRRINSMSPETNVLALTMVDNEEYYLPVLQAGASGYLLKEADPGELLLAVKAVSNGEAYLSPAVARVVLGGVRGAGDWEDNGLAQLTPRERQVLELAAQGNTSREIAEQLFLGSKTVEKYRASAMHKLELHSRADLVRFAVAKGLLGPSGTEEGVTI